MYAFSGTLYAPEDEKRVLEKSKDCLQGAANNYQWALTRGLIQNCGESILEINSTLWAATPKNAGGLDGSE